ncbi:undecaprenyl-diphosphatase [bacterium A37T11]|nr:undecaprenyl-diphosphatase [bacterium A37T11]
MFDHLIQLDQEIFLMINQGLSNPVFDWLMPHLRNPWTWAPLYLFILIFTIKNYKKRGIIMMLFLLMTFGLADSISSTLIKPMVTRIRPCNETVFKEVFSPRIRCGSGFSFPSSHATNHFALAMFLIMVFKKRWKHITWLGLLWATSIGFAQVYVGVHYPIDVLAGAILGCFIGWLLGKTFNYFQPDNRDFSTDIIHEPIHH